MTSAEVVVALCGIVMIMAITIGLPWLILHYIVQWRKAGQLSADEERMLEDVWRAARSMEHRIDTLERILDAQTPGARRVKEG